MAVMNIPLLIAGILSLVAFLAHAFVGDQEYRQLKPATGSPAKLKETWVQVRSGWHWVSVDLLLSAILLLLISLTDYIQAKSEVLFLLSLYFLVTGIVWLITVFVSRNNTKQIFVLGQWIFCFVVSALVYYGRMEIVG